MKKSTIICSIGLYMLQMMACTTASRSEEEAQLKIDKDERFDKVRDFKDDIEDKSMLRYLK